MKFVRDSCFIQIIMAQQAAILIVGTVGDCNYLAMELGELITNNVQWKIVRRLTFLFIYFN